jgi:hypothetical protein
MTAKRANAVFFAGLIATTVVAALLSMSMLRYLDRPTSRTWTIVDKFVAGAKEADDSVAFFPPWLAGYARDEKRFLALDFAGQRELFGPGPHIAPRIWTISCFGALNPKKMEAAGWKSIRETKINQVTVNLYVRGESAISFRLSDRWAATAGGARTNDQVEYWPSIAANFGGHPAWAVFRGLRRRGVPAPLHAGRDLFVQLDNLPPGELVVCGGLSDIGIFRLDTHPLDAWVFAGERAQASVHFPVETGWRCTSAGAAGAPRQIVLRSDSATDRQFLFDVFVRDAPAAAPRAAS